MFAGTVKWFKNTNHVHFTLGTGKRFARRPRAAQLRAADVLRNACGLLRFAFETGTLQAAKKDHFTAGIFVIREWVVQPQ